ncbi:MAG TPA: hypothetical protein VGD80_29265, partial [Kofleriaceae bacterium]
ALGEKLWGGASDREIASKLGNGEIPTLDRRTRIDPDLRAICERALAPGRAQRYASAGHLKIDLARYLSKLGGPVAQREIAQFVRTVLADDRARLEATIDAQLQKIGAQRWDTMPTLSELPRITLTPSSAPPPASSIRFVAFSATLLVAVVALVAVQPRASSWSRSAPAIAAPPTIAASPTIAAPRASRR